MIIFSFAARADRRLSQEHMSITVGPYHLTDAVNFLSGRKPEDLEKTHDFRQSVDLLLFSQEDWVRVTSVILD